MKKLRVTVARLDASREADLFRVLACEEGSAWCACVAWHVDSWSGFGERSQADNRELRDALLAGGAHDGYLAYDRDAPGEPVGWCQAAPRAALAKAARDTADLDEKLGDVGDHRDGGNIGTWAIGCFVVPPAHRRRGVARALLAGVLADLPARGARRVLAFPKRGADEPGELWNGPEALFLEAGFRVARDDEARPVLVLGLPRG